MSKKKSPKKMSVSKGVEKKHLEEFDVTDGKERDKKQEALEEVKELEELLGMPQMNPYGTLNRDIFRQKLESSSASELTDLAARVGETFKFKPNGRREGLLKNKKAYLVITSGGTKLNSKEDFLTPWLRFILNFFGIKKINLIYADQMALNYEKSIKDAEEQINQIK